MCKYFLTVCLQTIVGWMEAILRKVYENSPDEMKRRIETGMEEGRRAAIEGYKKGAGMVSSSKYVDIPVPHLRS